MTEVMITRGGQITLTKDVRQKLNVREGDTVLINVLGDSAMVSKRDPNAFNKHNFLPENFSKTLKRIRTFSMEERLHRLGITK